MISCSDEYYRLYYTTAEPDVIEIENVVTADSAEKHPSLTENKDKEWLLLFYIAADNKKTNDALFYQMAQISRGLKSIYRYDGVTPKKDYTNVTAIALWDGFNTDNSSTTPKFYLPNTYLFEIKYPNQNNTDDIIVSYSNFCNDVSNDVILSGNNWLGPYKEVNTADKDTLSNFLKWSLEKYNPQNNKRIILFIEGLAGGSFGEETGSFIPPSSRATCRDNSSESFYLSAGEIKTALEENGFNNSNKLEMLILNSSFSSSLEDLFEYKDCIKSIIASPSEVPGGAIDYNYFLKSLRKNSTIYSIGTEAVNVYANRNYSGNNETTYGTASLSFIDLDKKTINNENIILELANNVNLLADEIYKSKDVTDEYNLVEHKYQFYECMTKKAKGDFYNFFGFDDNDYYYPNQIMKNSMYYKANYQHQIAKQDFFTGYFYQYDLAFMAHAIARTAEKNGISNIYYYCNQIKQNLKDCIVSTWRNGTQNKNGLYPTLLNNAITEFQTSTGAKPGSDFIFPNYGITITGPATKLYNEYIQPYNFSEFSYKNYKYNGKNNWKDLLELIYPEQFKECELPAYKN